MHHFKYGRTFYVMKSICRTSPLSGSQLFKCDINLTYRAESAKQMLYLRPVMETATPKSLPSFLPAWDVSQRRCDNDSW